MADLTATKREEERAMAQTVTMQIEYRANIKHLHLKANTVLSVLKGGGPVTWNVEILPPNPAVPIPLNLRPNQVRLWFPLPDPLFFDSTGVLSREITIGPFAYTTSDNKGKAVTLLTPNAAFPLVGNENTVIPLAIYADVDEGQDPTPTRPGNRKNLFHQKGVQMVEGAHSHPECEVGP